MIKIAIIGAGISGMTVAHLLKDKYCVTVYEKESTPGGLIRCRRVNGSLFHMCGGHVFNSNRQDVLDCFFGIVNKDEFVKKNRNSTIIMENGHFVPYPIENHIYCLDENLQRAFIEDCVKSIKKSAFSQNTYENFEDFLKHRFGETLYKIYFQPYNEKIWRKDLKKIPLSWLDGKLPAPTVEDMLFNNINRIEEKQFVHSVFWYPQNNGSQYIADTFAKNINIIYGTEINRIDYWDGKWIIENDFYDKVFFCGNIKDLIKILNGIDITRFFEDIESLDYHGTTSVFCEIAPNPYTWIYQPSRKHLSHRIICTGNFSPNNNALERLTATVEFTDAISKVEIEKNLQLMPYNPKYIDSNYTEYAYPIQNNKTRAIIKELKAMMCQYNFFFTGRFADWEYYNMDSAIGAAMDLINSNKI